MVKKQEEKGGRKKLGILDWAWYGGLVFLVLVVIVTGVWFFQLRPNDGSQTSNQDGSTAGSSAATEVISVDPEAAVDNGGSIDNTEDVSVAPTAVEANADGQFLTPISKARERITKKPFGIYVTPQNSPVSPERFSGYHTGTDFEILPGEEDAEVRITAVCAGDLKFKGSVNGYGGVLVQACEYQGNSVRVLYGHLNIAGSTVPNVGDRVQAGDEIAVLGAGYSAQTSGERKHLHLGIKKGSQIDFKGYVGNESLLGGWLDWEKVGVQ